MARLSHALGVAPSDGPERGTAELTQLLARLERTILHADHERERRLRSSEYERARLNANLDYARKLLTRLEQQALGFKVQPRRLEVQTDLNRRRELLDRLVDRMHDLGQLHNEEEDDSSGDEDLLSDLISTPSESTESRSTGATPARSAADVPVPDPSIPDVPPPPTEAQATEPPSTTTQEARVSAPTPTDLPADPASQTAPATIPPTTTTQTLRARGSQAAQPQDTAATTARAALFASRRSNAATATNSADTTAGSKAAATTSSSTATAEAILDHQRAEQDALSGSILKMASALKASSQRFSSTLEEDKAMLSRAGEGMDRTEKGMDAAGRRMGALKRMTEGKGWWGRMMLFAMVYGMMLVLLVLVFVMPKLRF